MTESEWLEALAIWADVWPTKRLPASSYGTWYRLLADLDGQTVVEALLAWANDPERKRPPTSPGEVRAATLPDEVWTDLLADLAVTVRRHGRYVPRPPLPDVLDAYVDSMGGWTSVCSRLDPSDPTIRAQFRDHVQQWTRRARRDQAAALSGPIAAAITDADTPTDAGSPPAALRRPLRDGRG